MVRDMVRGDKTSRARTTSLFNLGMLMKWGRSRDYFPTPFPTI